MVMTTLLQIIIDLINIRKNRILNAAQLCMSEFQFKVFRKTLLDELGRSGLEKDLARALAEKQRKER
ncbi:MAG: hypothetical protein H6937_06245 [Burkholderiales bacterium]|nr:hypothetical protein [Burkholderiales bacterium]